MYSATFLSTQTHSVLQQAPTFSNLSEKPQHNTAKKLEFAETIKHYEHLEQTQRLRHALIMYVTMAALTSKAERPFRSEQT